MSVVSQGSEEAPSFLSSYYTLPLFSVELLHTVTSLFSVELEQVLVFCRVRLFLFFVELEQTDYPCFCRVTTTDCTAGIADGIFQCRPVEENCGR